MPNELGEATHRFQIFKVTDLDSCKEKMRVKGYTPVPLKTQHSELELHTNAYNNRPRWVDILDGLVENQSDLSELVNRNSSFILFITEREEVFAVCGGQGSSQIREFTTDGFGLDIVSRVVEPSKIKLKRAKNLAGRTAEEQIIYKEYNYSFDGTNWGKITKEILGEISRMDLNHYFGLAEDRVRKIRLDGKSSITVHRSITIPDLKTLISKIVDIETLENKFTIITGYAEVADKETRANLWAELAGLIAGQYESYLFDSTSFEESSIGLSHPDMKDFLLCDSYIIKVGDRHQSEELNSVDLGVIFKVLRASHIRGFTEGSLDTVRIIGRDADGQIQIDSKLKNCLYAETLHNQQTYFLVDSKWLKVEDDFITSINNRVEEILRESQGLSQGYTAPLWKVASGNTESEDDYIDGFCKISQVLKLHRDHIIINGSDKTEVCDIVDTRQTNTKFLYVKRGLGSAFREMLAQTRSSAELFKHFPAFRQAAQSKIDTKANGSVTCEPRQLHLILAFTDKSTNRQNTPLVERLTTIVKVDLIHTMESLQSELGYSNSYLFEIMHG